jgi:hypothetical protein
MLRWRTGSCLRSATLEGRKIVKRTTSAGVGRVRVALAAAVATVATLFVVPAPAAEAFPVEAFAFGGNSHASLTRAMLTRAVLDYFGISNPSVATRRAIDDIVAANEAVDGDQVSSAKHFDGENFGGGKALIQTHFSNTVALLLIGNPSGARLSFGAALHTIQDFYAHSNWVELGIRNPTRALWTIDSIGTVAGPREATCNGSTLTTTKLTSGYYGGEDRTPQIASKCRHGGPTDFSAGSGGINKDFNDTLLSPHATFHTEAARQATAGSRLFLDDINFSVGQFFTEELLAV